jgi:hypothetical protein
MQSQESERCKIRHDENSLYNLEKFLDTTARGLEAMPGCRFTKTPLVIWNPTSQKRHASSFPATQKCAVGEWYVFRRPETDTSAM